MAKKQRKHTRVENISALFPEPRDAAEEFDSAARDPGTADRWKRLSPVIAAAVLSLPLLWFSVRFSLLVGQVFYYMLALNTPNSDLIGVFLMVAGGFICLLATALFLVLALRRDSWGWRLGFSATALACAAFMPAIGLFAGLHSDI